MQKTLEKEPEELTAQDKLWRVSEATNDDGTVNVQILDWIETGNGMIKVEFVTPTGRRRAETMRFPTRDSEQFKFVRLCHEAGYELGQAQELSNVWARANDKDGKWTLEAEGDMSMFSLPSRVLQAIGASEVGMRLAGGVAQLSMGFTLVGVVIFLTASMFGGMGPVTAAQAGLVFWYLLPMTIFTSFLSVGLLRAANVPFDD